MINKKLLLIIGFTVLLHFIVSLITVPYFPKIAMEEPGYTASGHNLAIQGKKINEVYKDLNRTTSYQAYWDKIETFPPLYPYLLSYYLKVFPYELIPLRYLSVLAGGFLIIIFGYLSRKIFKNNIVFIILLILTISYIFRYITQQARPDIFVSLFSLITIYFLVNYIHGRQNLYILLAAITAPIAFLFHISGIIVLVGFYLTILIFLFIKKVSFKQLYILISISILVLFPYLLFLIRNFYYFKVQILNTYIGPAMGGFSWILNHIEGLFIVIYLVTIGIMSLFIMKKCRFLKILSIYYLSLLGVGLFLQIKIRYTLILFPLSIIIFTAFFQYYLYKWHKRKVFYIIIILILIVSSGHFILDALKYSKKDNSYWTIMEQIDEIVPERARIIGHPDFQWGIDSKNVTITECSDPNRLLSPFESYDFVIANETWQNRMLAPCWKPEIMSKLTLLGSYKNEIYDYKIYKIRKTDVP